MSEVVLHTEEYWELQIAGTQVPHMQSIVIPSGSFIPNDFAHENDQAKPESAKMPGKISWQDISGTKIMTDDTTIQEWFLQGDPVEGGGGAKVEKKEAAVIVYDAGGAEVRKYELTGVWPTSYAASASLDAGGGDTISEMFSLSYETCKVA